MTRGQHRELEVIVGPTGPGDLPHVDQILGQSHGLAVPTDGDGSVQVGGGVSVLAVGDPDHRSAYLPDQTIVSI